MRKVYFKVSGNKAMAYQLNNNCFLTSENRLKSSVDFGKNYNNDTSTYITMPVSFYKENFKYCRSTGIYRNDLQWKDLLQFMQVEKFTINGHVIIKTSDK